MHFAISRRSWDALQLNFVSDRDAARDDLERQYYKNGVRRRRTSRLNSLSTADAGSTPATPTAHI